MLIRTRSIQKRQQIGCGPSGMVDCIEKGKQAVPPSAAVELGPDSGSNSSKEFDRSNDEQQVEWIEKDQCTHRWQPHASSSTELPIPLLKYEGISNLSILL